MTRLPNTPGYTIISVLADGRIFGNYNQSTNMPQCAEYQNGAWSLFSTPGYSCLIEAANQSGQFVGVLVGPGIPNIVNGINTGDDSQPMYPFAYLNGAITPLTPPGLVYGQTSNLSSSGGAGAINASGAVLGYVQTSGATGVNSTSWIYSGGQYRVLSSSAASSTAGLAINNNGLVVGSGYFGPAPSTSQHPAIFNTDGSVKDLGTLGGSQGYAYAVNSSGQVTGCANTSALYQIENAVDPFRGTMQGPAVETCHAFIYDGTSMQEIQIPGANYYSSGGAINDAGDVLGGYTNEFNDDLSSTFLNDGAFYYHAGVMYRLDATTIQGFPAEGVSAGASFVVGTNQIWLSVAVPNGAKCQPGATLGGCYTLQSYLLTPAAASTAQPSITAVVNGASFAAPISSSSWITIEGGNLSTITRLWNGSDFSINNLPLALDGVSVTVNGTPAYPYYISPTQLNVLAPDGIAPGQVQVQVNNPQGASNTFTVNATAATPAFFATAPGYAAAEHSNGVPVGKAALVAGATFTPAQPGETIALYGTGFGAMNPFSPAGQILAAPAELSNTVTVTIGGQPAVVAYAGVVSSGLDQLNVTVPPGLPNGDAPIVATVNGVSTQSGLAITVQK
jgi:uncharacterized protein (TIGR03437 family)